MAKAKAKKRSDMENELMTHVDMIKDPKIKEYISERKTEKERAKRERQDRSGPRKTGIWQKDGAMSDEEESDTEKVDEKVLAKIKAKVSSAKKLRAIAAKSKAIRK